MLVGRPDPSTDARQRSRHRAGSSSAAGAGTDMTGDGTARLGWNTQFAADGTVAVVAGAVAGARIEISAIALDMSGLAAL